MNLILVNLIVLLNVLLICCLGNHGVEGCKGCVALDEFNFDKIITRFEAVLVKFDVAYPYGEKHDVYTKLAEELSGIDELLIAEVGVKDYGDKENEPLALKYGITKDDLPALRLFTKKNAVVPFQQKDSSPEWNLDNLRNLIRDNTDIYIGLPGCLQEFDKLSMEFVHSGNKQQLLEKATEKLMASSENADIASIYVKFMKKIIENGTSFIPQELGRLNKLIKDGKIHEKKKTELNHRLNILRSFSITKDEL